MMVMFQALRGMPQGSVGRVTKYYVTWRDMERHATLVESNTATFQGHVVDMLKRSPICISLPIHCLNLCYSLGSYSLIALYSLFRVDDGGIIMALLQRVTSCQLQLITQEYDLETPFQYLRSCMP